MKTKGGVTYINNKDYENTNIAKNISSMSNLENAEKKYVINGLCKMIKAVCKDDKRTAYMVTISFTKVSGLDANDIKNVERCFKIVKKTMKKYNELLIGNNWTRSWKKHLLLQAWSFYEIGGYKNKNIVSTSSSGYISSIARYIIEHNNENNDEDIVSNSNLHAHCIILVKDKLSFTELHSFNIKEVTGVITHNWQEIDMDTLYTVVDYCSAFIFDKKRDRKLRRDDLFAVY